MRVRLSADQELAGMLALEAWGLRCRPPFSPVPLPVTQSPSDTTAVRTNRKSALSLSAEVANPGVIPARSAALLRLPQPKLGATAKTGSGAVAAEEGGQGSCRQSSSRGRMAGC